MDPLPITMISETSPVAHLPHRCSVCNGTIQTGEKHTRLVYRNGDVLDPKTGREQFVAIRCHIYCPPY